MSSTFPIWPSRFYAKAAQVLKEGNTGYAELLTKLGDWVKGTDEKILPDLGGGVRSDRSVAVPQFNNTLAGLTAQQREDILKKLNLDEVEGTHVPKIGNILKTIIDQLDPDFFTSAVSKQTERLNNRVVNALGVEGFDEASNRRYTHQSTLVSKENFCKPLFPSSLVAADDPHNFIKCVRERIQAAQKFIILEAFELENNTIVQDLIDAAKRGVKVVLLVDPSTEPPLHHQKKVLLEQLRAVGKQTGNLLVQEQALVPTTPTQPFEQIMHIKRLMTDGGKTAPGSIFEISGGINFGKYSHFNFDFATEIEGVSALDSVRLVLQHFMNHHVDRGLPQLLKNILKDLPKEQQLIELLKTKVTPERQFTSCELGRSQRCYAPMPQTMKEIAGHLKAIEAPGVRRQIIVSSQDLMANIQDLLPKLQRAARLGCQVIVVEDNFSPDDRRKLNQIKDNSRGLVKVDAPGLKAKDWHFLKTPNEVKSQITKYLSANKQLAPAIKLKEKKAFIAAKKAVKEVETIAVHHSQLTKLKFEESLSEAIAAGLCVTVVKWDEERPLNKAKLDILYRLDQIAKNNGGEVSLFIEKHKPMTTQAIAQVIQHYQRLTKNKRPAGEDGVVNYPGVRKKPQIYVSPDDAFNNKACNLLLNKAAEMGIPVTVYAHNATLKQTKAYETAQNKFDYLTEKLRLDAIHYIKADDFTHDDSYRQMVYRELDNAIDRATRYSKALAQKRNPLPEDLQNCPETIQVCSFALSDSGVLKRLAKLGRIGHENPPSAHVQVLVDSLTIEGQYINRKAITYLTAHGVDVREVDPEVIKKVTGALNMHIPDEAGERKNHSKVIRIGNRLLYGSSNFSNQAFAVNIEMGRMVTSKDLTTMFEQKLFTPVWEHALRIPAPDIQFNTEPVSGNSTIQTREPLIPAVSLDTKVKDILWNGYDTETDGLAIHLGDIILSISFYLDFLKNIHKDPSDPVATANYFIKPGFDQRGKQRTISKRSTAIHELTLEHLNKEGEDRSVVVKKLVTLMKDQLKQANKNKPTPMVLFGMNIFRFDNNGTDRTLGMVDVDGKRYHIDIPTIDILELSRKVDPFAEHHNLDAICARYGVSKRKSNHHNSLEDSTLTYQAFCALVQEYAKRINKNLEDLTLRDLLPNDEIDIKVPLHLSVDADGKRAAVIAEGDDGKKVIEETIQGTIQYIKDIKSIEVLPEQEIKNDHFKLKITVDDGNGIDHVIYRYAPISDVLFRKPGAVCFAAREMWIKNHGQKSRIKSYPKTLLGVDRLTYVEDEKSANGLEYAL